ncbi:translation initiation factor IF-2 [Solitalea koreensis]|uniref:Translation initiation factor IF-2 n=1 Tax=Solitalea koreensis TaxID=543615 RepID=A0A521CGN7_9SPHI|nr:translation initiation factor IF-2 [Solitalea koreensis]SMO58598.1 translation initiation factor IF-2 [Solitalea koreensis]
MSEDKNFQLLKVAKELNISIATIAEYLGTKGFRVEPKPGAKINDDMYTVLLKEFQSDKTIKEEAKHIHIGKIRRDEVSIDESLLEKPKPKEVEQEEILIKNIATPAEKAEKPKEEPVKPKEEPVKPEENTGGPQIESSEEIQGVKVVGRIDLDALNTRTRPDKKAVREEKPIVPQVKEEEKKAEVKPEPTPERAPVPTPEPTVAPEPKPEVKVVAPEPKIEEKPVVKEKPSPVAAAVPEPPKVKPVAEKAPEAPVASESTDEAVKPEEDVIKGRAQRLSGPNIIGKIVLPVEREKKGSPVASSSDNDKHKRKRKRKDGQGNTNPNQQQQGTGQGTQQPRQFRPGQGQTPAGPPRQVRQFDHSKSPHSHNRPNQGGGAHGHHGKPVKEEVDEKKVQEQIKQTLAKLTGAGKQNKFAAGRKHRRQKRDDFATSREEASLQQELESKILKVTEFVTANELANMMDVPVTQIISTCMSLGMFVSINQRLDAETLTIVADEFGYTVEFVSADIQEEIEEDIDDPADLIPRSPVVAVMGHVDHGKTSLLDFIRKANVIAGEAGGITQHIGAYNVKLENGKKITFLDTPGHEAFTAMRARGAKVTDIAIIVIAADDAVMPQTTEAINHAQAAGVPIIFAFNKIDKDGANADKVREQLANMNILVEEWGGKFQTQEISAKKGLNIDLLLEKVLLEAELLELKANPERRAVGTVIEAALDKGRGIVTTVLIQTGTLTVGDPILAGSHSGRVKAMFNERGVKIEKAGPSTPVQVLGMQGAPQAGDKFIETKSEQEAREIATKRMQLLREQGLRTQKHITLDEIGRRLAIGNFKELNIIVKGDVDGSVEALSDSLLKLSTEEIQVNIIHKSVGQISESDVLLASASDAIIIGFQVRPSASARKLAEHEQIDIRMYSIIYKAIEEIKLAMEGMLSPEIEEKIVANVEIRETFKITKVGTIAGCMVLDGKINRNSKIRIVRDGVVIHNGELASLKRFKDDVKEVATGYECGLNIKNFNDIQVGDIVEAYEEVEVKRKL